MGENRWGLSDSSDSDFTRLATRMREAGLAVYGFGEKKTPKPFVAACDKFIFTEILGEPEKKNRPRKADEDKLRELLTSAVSSTAQEDGWANLGTVGSHLNRTIRRSTPATLVTGSLVTWYVIKPIWKLTTGGATTEALRVSSMFG